MKRVLSVFFILIITVVCFISASAHPGRTDSNGGHWNHDTGEYHYHNGGTSDHRPNSGHSYDVYETTRRRYYYNYNRATSEATTSDYIQTEFTTKQENKIIHYFKTTPDATEKAVFITIILFHVIGVAITFISCKGKRK